MNDKVAVLDKLMGDQYYQKRREIGSKYKNRGLSLRILDFQIWIKNRTKINFIEVCDLFMRKKGIFLSRKNLVLVLIFLVISVSLFNSHEARSQEEISTLYSIRSALVEQRMLPDGKVKVYEKIEYQMKEPFSGLSRKIPPSRYVEFESVRVWTEGIETEYTEYLRKDEKGFEVRCWLVPYKSEQRLDPKEHPSVSLHVSYVAKYVLENGLDVAQVFRQFWGLWNAPIGHLQGIFEFPPSVYIRNVYTRPEIVFKRVGNRFEFSLKDLPPFTYVETRFVMYPAPEIFFSTKNPSLTMKEIKQIEKKYLLFTYYLTENPEVIRKAIEAGADVNAQDTDGRTPLMLAARWNRNPKVIKMLLNAGADKKIKCNNGKKAFDYAKENEFINSTEVYHLLKDTDTPQILSMVAFREMRQAIQDINKPMIRVDELIMKYGNPTYNLRVFISQRKFYRHILVYEVEKEDGTIFFVALTIRSHNNYSPVGKLIDSNVVTVDNLRDLIWPGWGMRLVDCLISETNIQERYNSIERQKEIESVRTRINTSLGDITSDTQAQFFNEQHLFSAQAYKNVSKGKLILAFELNPEIGIMAPGFLVRLFDKNGHFLYHFFTEEMYKTFGLNHEQFQIPMIIVYNVPSMFLRETHYVEMGFSP
jgi:hypothetical protein